MRELTAERDRLRKAYRELELQLELQRRRLFVAKAERVDSSQLEFEFAATVAAMKALAAQGGGDPNPGDGEGDVPPPEVANKPSKTPAKPTGRRDVRELDIPEERIELSDPELEGKAERIGFEESCRLMWRRGGFVRLVVARPKYRLELDSGDVLMETAPKPPETLERSLAAPSLLAHVLSSKFCDGLPLHRLQDIFARDGVPLDRSTMCRWVEDIGATLGATVVHAMRIEAMTASFCVATDATGIAVQPPSDGKSADKKRKPCKRGHFFVLIADGEHVLFEYHERETSKGVAKMFHGFSGYVQADAKSVFDILFVSPAKRRPPDDGTDPDDAVRHEVGCWSHARRKFWEAAFTKNAVAREALVRIGRFFDREQEWKGQPPSKIRALRARYTRPELEAFFMWAQAEYDKVKAERGTLRSALGYVVRQRDALMRFLEDGRLKPDNNRSERELRRIAVGRKAWLFVGDDDHAEAAGHLFSVIASARLHGLDPERYLRDIIRVLVYWPRDRYLELAPRYWPATRARLDVTQLEAEVGPLTVPPPAQVTPAEQTASC